MGKEQVFSCARDIAMRLKEHRKYGKASVMVGAGFSKNAKSKGMNDVKPPDWSQLADKMYCELYPQSENMTGKQKEKWNKQRIIKTSGKNATKLAEEYTVSFDRNKMNHLIENAIADDLFLPGDLHKKLVKLSWSDIFTTNYDTLLERAANMVFCEANYQIVCSCNDIAGSISPRIVKLHGSIPHVKPYIICDEDYRTYPVKYAAMVNTVQQAMLETRLCLIGFSGDDPNFQNWMGWIRDNMGECCPIIYLIGIYDNLSEPERRLLESRQIIIVDISCLAEGGNADRHGTAVSEFLDLLEKYQEEKDIFQERPYPEADIFWKPEDKGRYIEDMGEYLEQVAEKMQPYILFPTKIKEKGLNRERSEKYKKYFMEHLWILVHVCKEELPLMAVADIVKILRKYSVVLGDENAKGMEEICENCKDISSISDEKLGALAEIILYLAEMYRIDGKTIEYERKVSLLESFINRVPWYKNELLIEKIKYKIEYFEYGAAKKLAGEIEENSFEYKVKKAGFYKQLSEYGLADKILSRCSSELSQMKIPKDIYASYMGYLNLCYRSNRWDISEEYADDKCFENPYNTRHIVIWQRDDLSRAFFKDDCKESRRILPFDLNVGKSITVASYTGIKDTYIKSFSYLVTLDKLCLPFFSDLADLLPRVFKEVAASSSCTYWKLSLIARSNNDKLIDQVFTRETIGAACERDIGKLFRSLASLAGLYEPEDDYFQKKYIISLKNLLDILSRLVVFMPDESVVQYLMILGRISRNGDSRIDKDINRILQRIATRFNGVVAVSCQGLIFKEFGVQFHLASYFSEFPFDIDKEYARDYYLSAIQLVGKGVKERDCGISRLLLLWKNHKLEDLRKRIEEVLWDGDVLPGSELYYPFIWEELPHPADVKFSELYYRYLLEDRYLTSVTGFGVVRTNSLDSVRNYLNFFYATSGMSKRKIEKVAFDEKLAVFMLDTALNFIQHEKSLLNNDFEKYSAEKKFEYIVELTALIYIQSIDRGFAASVNGKINEIWKILEDNQVVTDAIRMVDEINNARYSLCMEIFENTVLSRNQKNYSSVFTGIRCLLFHFESKGESNAEIDSLFKKFMGSIKYLDIEYSKTIWIQVAPLLMQEYFMDIEAQRYISSAIRKCMELYSEPAGMGQRFYMDGLYNCVNALHSYYDCISGFHTEISQELEECAAEAKVIDNYEIKNIWH